MKAKPQIPLAIAGSVVALFFGTSGLAQSKPSADKPAAVTSQPSSTSAAPTSPAPTSAVPTSATSTPPKGTATVEFRNGMLHIIATDADLNSVLQQVSRVTGMRLQGGTHGDRLYGDYGPAAAADVLDHMLDGLPYNFIMTQAPRTPAPQQLVISSQHRGAATVAPGGPTGGQAAQPLSAEQQPDQTEPEESTQPAEEQPTVDVNFGPTNSATESQSDNTNRTPDAKTAEQFLEELKTLHENDKPQ